MYPVHPNFSVAQPASESRLISPSRHSSRQALYKILRRPGRISDIDHRRDLKPVFHDNPPPSIWVDPINGRRAPIDLAMCVDVEPGFS
ncbi:MAG: hypothetical protein KTR25_12755 [Myxococcales bacterium]|nr:hypothetical protein [Myxococcales bacterium]